ncbi:ParB N-terminal domain-containing protein [Mycolicibacterium sp.]|uniref:ParB N-terminal domain-containing protein n=1 Tax=Mycolicibacterium sp. TaxID=2320850 RepID=UPI00355FF1F6
MSLSELRAQAPQLRFVPLRDLEIAPENVRGAEPADDGIDRLADTIAGADLVVPLCVRPGRRGEKPFTVLDGRRRLLALRRLLAAGRATEDRPVRCEVFASAAGRTAA